MKKSIITIEEISNMDVWRAGLVDTHFHSSALRQQGVDPEALLGALTGVGMGALVDVAIQPEDLAQNEHLDSFASPLFRSCGLHPSVCGREDWKSALDTVAREIATGRFAAIGETGLDWYRLYAPRERQLAVFEAQLAIASRADRPVIVHNRNADQDCLTYLHAASLQKGGIMHCFSSDPEWVRPFLDEGFYISFAGNITFGSANTLRESLRCVPLDRLLLETDAPFLTPHPHRGRINHPGMVAFTYAVAAQIRGCSVETLIERISRNLKDLFVNTSPVVER